MNREINFRAWDKNRKSMIDWFTMSQSTWNKGVTTLMYDILVSNKMNFDLMQYTGLKDKNGKEIYEGDIFSKVSASELGGDVQYFYVVVWSSSDIGVKCRKYVLDEDDNGCHFLLKQGGYLDSLQMVNMYNYVIGNIYENPELLK